MTDDVVRALATVPVFASCRRTELRRLAAIATRCEVRPGRVLMREHDLAREAFVVLSGAVAVMVAGERVAELGVGELVGEIAMLDRSRPRTATVVVTEPAELLLFDVGAFPVLRSSRGVVRQLVALAERRTGERSALAA